MSRNVNVNVIKVKRHIYAGTQFYSFGHKPELMVARVICNALISYVDFFPILILSSHPVISLTSSFYTLPLLTSVPLPLLTGASPRGVPLIVRHPLFLKCLLFQTSLVSWDLKIRDMVPALADPSQAPSYGSLNIKLFFGESFSNLL